MKTKRRTETPAEWYQTEGTAYPPGSAWIDEDRAYNFNIYSRHAAAVTLLLYGADDLFNPLACIALNYLRNKSGRIWHCRVPQSQIGAARYYAYSIYGPSAPEPGDRFDPQKVLLDPYARRLFFPPGFNRRASCGPGSNAGKAPLAQLPQSDPFDWGSDSRVRHTSDTVIYEMHVRGFTRRDNSRVSLQARGTYAGVIEKIPYLKELGVTVVELLPVFQFDPDGDNYWGYMPMAFFVPHHGYLADSSDAGMSEFRTMVKALHEAGIEVILDVVYNHTAEGSHLGPTLAFRGIDNIAYYRLRTEKPRFYLDFTGTGNTFNLLHPRTLQLVMDSLRYWVLEMHVDGFRFDLASALARDANGVNKFHAFFEIIHQDPVLSQVKLIAEPWDVGEGGYQVGNFPVLWAEWNGKYRDAIRSFWKGDEGRIGEVAYRLTSSPDLYNHDGRRPYASINFVTCHDGFTLTDLVSYNEKHNEANGEKNHDGDNNNLSWNHGVEGPTDDPKINALRERQRRNFVTTLFVSQGVPMFLGGDEFGRTQNGNNNAYCQDNEISWLNWERRDEKQKALFEFTRQLIQLRREHPVFRRPKFLQGRQIRGSKIKDVMWFNPGGNEMSDEE